jgi:hypothetical protein
MQKAAVGRVMGACGRGHGNLFVMHKQVVMHKVVLGLLWVRAVEGDGEEGAFDEGAGWDEGAAG